MPSILKKQFMEPTSSTYFVLNAVQPQGLLVAQLVCLYLRDQGCSVVAAALGEAGAARQARVYSSSTKILTGLMPVE